MKGKVVIERNMFYGAKRDIFIRACELRTNLTTAEEILWEKLSDRRLFKVNFRRQHPIDIFIVDFYCHKYKLAIEVDGDIHLDEDVLSHDKGREFEIEKLGIKILQFTNREVMVEIIEVTNKILH